MNRNDISAVFTEKVNALMAEGYILNPATMTGSQGEVAKVDLRKGDDLLRVCMETKRDWDGGCMLLDYIAIYVGRCTDPSCLDHGFGGLSGRTVWNHELQVIDEVKFAIIGENYFTTVEEGMKIAEKRRERILAREAYGTTAQELTADDAKRIALKFIKRQPRMRSCKVEDIKKVERLTCRENRRSAPAFSGYRITARGKDFYLKPVHA